MKTWKKVLTLGTASALALTMSACGARGGDGASEAADGAIKVGVALPQKTSENWVEAEGLFQKDCEEAKLDCQIQFANSGVQEQQSQIDSMITKGVKVLIIGAIDGGQLSTQLAKAKKEGIKVVAYDRLLTNTKDIDYYIAYDNFGVGKLQGQALLDGLKEKGVASPAKVELFAGSPDDANSMKFFNGAMDVLQPKIDAGELQVVSGQTEFTQASTQGWKAENAQKRMDAILQQHYSGDNAPDGVLSPNDTLARAILTSIEQANKPAPVVTGQDSENESVKLVAEGKQYSTIFKDTRALVKQSVSLAKAIAGTDEVPTLDGVAMDDKQYESVEGNPVKAFLLTPQIVTKSNIKEVYQDDENRSKIVAEVLK
ncbi:MAG: sugar ABC transporter substrate-binding protein [Actinomycetaceae bacterium]|nr:sugar ABC transporter substrate-binding protein [Actinomycetaceae bacterium]